MPEEVGKITVTMHVECPMCGVDHIASGGCMNKLCAVGSSAVTREAIANMANRADDVLHLTAPMCVGVDYGSTPDEMDARAKVMEDRAAKHQDAQSMRGLELAWFLRKIASQQRQIDKLTAVVREINPGVAWDD